MYGFYNRVLHVNLTNRSFKIDASHRLGSLGGKDLATRLLLEQNPPGVDPLSEENRLIFATGPFCQSRLWGGSRYGVYTKSPQTGCYAESYSGGKVPEAVDAAGFDAICFTGQSPDPVVVTVHTEGAVFSDAADLWGKDTIETETEAVRRFVLADRPLKKKGAVAIGPAGENRVACAIISNDKWRCAGRTGTGAVMGSKRLKAIVFQGDRRRTLYAPDKAKRFAAEFAKTHAASPGAKAYKAMGTTMMVSLMNTVGAFPTRYWRRGRCDHWEKINGETYHRDHDITPHACAKCFMACGRLARIRSGPRKGLKIEGPEYETIYAFGGLCMVADMGDIAYLNDLCDRLGLDTITAGNLCGLVIEAAAQRRLDCPVSYGDTNAIAGLIRDIATRQGLGAVLAGGIRAAAAELGISDLAIHVKGLEPAGYDPRVLKGMGLTFATSPRGACHLRTTFYKPELAGMIPPDQTKGKAEMLIDYEDRLNIFDSMILCRFYRDMYTWEALITAIRLVTGKTFDKRELRARAAEIADMTRRFNQNEGITPADDALPGRFHTEPLEDGSLLTAEEMDLMRRDYYRLRGWTANP